MQDEIYGASTRQMMLNTGLRAGMRVLDLACGTGIMSHWELKRVADDESVPLAQAQMPVVSAVKA